MKKADEQRLFEAVLGMGKRIEMLEGLLKQASSAPVQGTVQVQTAAPRRMPVSWFAPAQPRETEVGEWHVAGFPVAGSEPRTKLLELNMGQGRFGMTPVYVPKSEPIERVLEALRHEDEVVLEVGRMRLRLIRRG